MLKAAVNPMKTKVHDRPLRFSRNKISDKLWLRFFNKQNHSNYACGEKPDFGGQCAPVIQNQKEVVR